MRIGCPKEIKAQECRVGLTPAGVDALVRAGHEVYMEDNAGLASGFPNEEYIAQGAKILPTAKEVYDIADMIVKVKEPLEPEYELMHEGQIMFTYLHLAPDPEQTQALLRQKVTGIAYETVQLADRSLPLLQPMSEVAGRLAVQIGAQLLEHLAMGLIMGLADHIGHTQFFQIHGSQHRCRQIVADGNDGAVKILGTQSLQHILVPGICHDSLGYIRTDLLNQFASGVNGQHLAAQFTQPPGNFAAKPAKSDYDIGFHSVSPLSNQKICLGILEPLLCLVCH